MIKKFPSVWEKMTHTVDLINSFVPQILSSVVFLVQFGLPWRTKLTTLLAFQFSVHVKLSVSHRVV